eukprot:TRINITY_DN10965_c0_g1_i1.p1 TRINITY_DN10965_c0_g1~~TRINITY_DN10965_c0_g1_i1.p1  ORF type:complete len:581 (+),score=82.98 TRINITY_DN10965_c0_g1_i1:111-1745(+)
MEYMTMANITCETNHLSFFQVVAGAAVQSLHCSGLSFFSKEGLRALEPGEWLYAQHTIVLWSLCFVMIMVVCLGAILDRRDLWSDAYMHDINEHVRVAKRTQIQARSGQKSAGCLGLIRVACVDNVVRAQAIFLGIPRGVSRFVSELRQMRCLLAKARKGVLVAAMEKILAHRSGIDQPSLPLLLDAHAEARQSQFRSLNRSNASSSQPHSLALSAHVKLKLGRSAEALGISEKTLHAKATVVKASPLFSAFFLFCASHPWLAALRWSIKLSRASRMALVCARTASFMTVCACFGLNKAKSKTDEHCVGDSPEASLTQAMVKGLASAVFADGLTWLLAKIPRALDIQGLAELTDDELAAELRTVSVRRYLFWASTALYTFVSMFMLFLFVANVSQHDIDDWSKGAIISGLQLFLLMPMFVAVSMAVTCSCVLRCYPETAREFCDDATRSEQSVSQWGQHRDRSLSRSAAAEDAELRDLELRDIGDDDEIRSVQGDISDSDEIRSVTPRSTHAKGQANSTSGEACSDGRDRFDAVLPGSVRQTLV